MSCKLYYHLFPSHDPAGVAANYVSQVATKILDITDTSNQKVRFVYDSSHAITVMGSTNGNTTYMTFIRLGDT